MKQELCVPVIERENAGSLAQANGFDPIVVEILVQSVNCPEDLPGYVLIERVRETGLKATFVFDSSFA